MYTSPALINKTVPPRSPSTAAMALTLRVFFESADDPMNDAPVKKYPYGTPRDYAHRQQQPLSPGNGEKPAAHFQDMTARIDHAEPPYRKRGSRTKKAFLVLYLGGLAVVKKGKCAWGWLCPQFIERCQLWQSPQPLSETTRWIRLDETICSGLKPVNIYSLQPATLPVKF